MNANCEPFWMVYGLDQGAPLFRHHVRELAEKEAKRLADLYPGVKFYVMQTVGVASKVSIEYRNIPLDQIPF